MHSVLLTFFMCLKLKIHQPIYKESGIASKEGAIIKYMLWLLEGDLGYSAGFLLKSKYMSRLAISEQGLAFWLTPVTFQLKKKSKCRSMFRKARKKTGAQTTFSILEETKCSTTFWLLHQDLPRPWMWSAFYSVLVQGSMSAYMMALCNDAGLYGNSTEVTDRVVSFTPLFVPHSWKTELQLHVVKSKSQVSFVGIYVQILEKQDES